MSAQETLPAPSAHRAQQTTQATRVDFVKLSPTQNMTVLVRSVHPVASYRAIAAQLLSVAHVHAEQVGFVREATTPAAHVRLHMAGDEFCGNACMALAALTALESGLRDGERTEVTVESSGVEEPLTCRVERHGDDYECQLPMPAPDRVEPHPFGGPATGGSSLVRYDDAVHLVVECDELDPATRAHAEQVAAQLAAAEDVPLVGVMLYDPQRLELAPLVAVPSLDSLVWERSCGSGTAAVGAHLADAAGAPVSTDLLQPGGTMHVRADVDDEGGTALRISGRVRVVAEGTAYVHD
ncbi:hypothetical protein [Nocardioides sp. CFH 31398]|uniref:hypothetical protein n=1 Tax=Nocardioides sp. CFH 31398 TaxID=2919579 RepID=UPI001F067953|nr:hypothetical protein [Nocardioides sp. CFH 31398]MCH1867438.1 hypothetical protein [Nocardioides sp. CFH 31398]